MKNVLLIAIVTLFANTSFAQSPKQMNQVGIHTSKVGHQKLQKVLNLDATQKGWAKQIKHDTQLSIQPYLKELRSVNDTYISLITTADPDFVALDENLNRRNELMSKIEHLREVRNTVICNILDEEQEIKFIALQRKREIYYM